MFVFDDVLYKIYFYNSKSFLIVNLKAMNTNVSTSFTSHIIQLV